MWMNGGQAILVGDLEIFFRSCQKVYNCGPLTVVASRFIAGYSLLQLALSRVLLGFV